MQVQAIAIGMLPMLSLGSRSWAHTVGIVAEAIQPAHPLRLIARLDDDGTQVHHDKGQIAERRESRV